jgi:uncharacterized cupin superfamily protein
MTSPNIYDAPIDQARRHPGFHANRSFLGRRAGATRVGLSLWVVPSGQAAYPYHFHLAEEELLVVLEGEGAVRTPAGSRSIAAGDVVCFPVGADGAHQVTATTDLRFLAISPTGTPDIVIYPDSGKLAAAERRPDGGGVHEIFERSSAVDYMKGEEPER